MQKLTSLNEILLVWGIGLVANRADWNHKVYKLFHLWSLRYVKHLLVRFLENIIKFIDLLQIINIELNDFLVIYDINHMFYFFFRFPNEGSRKPFDSIQFENIENSGGIFFKLNIKLE